MKPRWYWYGLYRQGDRAPLDVQCVSTSSVPTDPSSQPLLRIYNSSGTILVTDQRVPPKARPTRTGLFGYDQLLDSNFGTGLYTAKFNYTIGGVTLSQLGMFGVVAGGNSQGAYTSLMFYDRPHADFLVGETEDTTLEFRRNPYL